MVETELELHLFMFESSEILGSFSVYNLLGLLSLFKYTHVYSYFSTLLSGH